MCGCVIYIYTYINVYFFIYTYTRVYMAHTYINNTQLTDIVIELKSSLFVTEYLAIELKFKLAWSKGSNHQKKKENIHIHTQYF